MSIQDKSAVVSPSAESETTLISDALPTADAVFSISLKQILEEFYRQYNPEKIGTIETILLSYEGREELLLNELEKKYEIANYSPFDAYIASRLVDSTPIASSNAPQISNERIVNANSTDSNQLKESTLSGLAAITSGVQDISSNLAGKLKGWGLGADMAAPSTNNSIKILTSRRMSNDTGEVANSFTSSDEILFTSRVNTLQSELATVESEKIALENTVRRFQQQVAAQKVENSTAKTALLEATTKIENLQRNIVAVIEREGNALKEVQLLTEKLKLSDKCSAELISKMELCELQKANKHAQLIETLQMNQGFENQIKALAVQALKHLSDDELNEIPTNSADFDKISKAMPENCVLLEALASITNSDLVDDIASEITILKKKYMLILTAHQASRGELRLEIKRNSELLDRITEQQASIEQLTASFRSYKEGNAVSVMNAADGSATTEAAEISVMTPLKKQLSVALETIIVKQTEIDTLKADLLACKDLLELAASARDDLTKICNDRIRDYAEKTSLYIQSIKNDMTQERVALLTHVADTAELQAKVQIKHSEDTQRELQHIRDELFKARRNETQKDREIAYLQRQLQESSKRIAALTFEAAAAADGGGTAHAVEISSSQR